MPPITDQRGPALMGQDRFPAPGQATPLVTRLQQHPPLANPPPWHYSPTLAAAPRTPGGQFDKEACHLGSDGAGKGGLAREVPGPGAYNPKKHQDSYRFPHSPTYSMAANRRHDPTRVARREDVPGPVYDVVRGIHHPDPRRMSAPAYTMAAYVPKRDLVDSPGPATALQNKKWGRRGLGFSFGLRDKYRDGGRSRNTYRFYSKAQAEISKGGAGAVRQPWAE